ncbi:hypothetical protein ACFQVD_26255 [Streptosporangium amethystogenes subsp. fukuiense]|uniref:Uncharacterized protein n=1 Tax=Streptosporangium amethystogenes subsp. fukuiense TaxID=698418 RepID=A0ABW2T7Z4_9ACTN
MNDRNATTTPASPASPDPASLPLLHSRTLRPAAQRPSGEQPSGWPDSIPGASCRDIYQQQVRKGGR